MLRRNLRLLRLGVTAGLRNPGLRLLGVLGALTAGGIAWAQGSLAGTTALVLATWLGRGFGAAACLWMAYAALRDQDERAGAVLRSKPVDGAHYVLLTWATGLCLWLLLLGLAFLGAALAQAPHAGADSFRSHGLGFLRAAAVLTMLATLSFTLSRLLRSPLGGVLTLFAWFCAMAGLGYIPVYLQPDYSQNRPLFLAAALFLLCLTALVVERLRRGELRRPALPAAVVVAALLLAAAGAAQAYRSSPAVAAGPYSVWGRMETQHLQLGQRAPGFWLPDGKGGTVRTAEHRGKILLIYLFAAADTDAARTLPALDAIRREYAARGVQPLGVCLSPDHGDGAALARAGGYGFPIGTDLSTIHVGVPPQSALAHAYDAQMLPLLVVTDRRRVARAIMKAGGYDQETLRRAVEERLAEEPE